MCMPKAPKPPPPPAQRQVMQAPEGLDMATDASKRRIRGFAALMNQSKPSLQPPATTTSLGG